MSIDRREEVISLVYDAALEGARWADALIAIADLTNSQQVLLQSYDVDGVRTAGAAPLTDPYWLEIWRENFTQPTPWRRRRKQFPVGHVYMVHDYIPAEHYEVLPAYRDWWRPQRMGTQMLNANVLQQGPAHAFLSVHKAERKGYQREDREAFASILDHVVRAVAIHRRLRLAELRLQATGQGPEGFALVDRNGRLLFCEETVRARLASAGLIVAEVGHDRVQSPNRAIERHLAAESAAGQGASCDYRDPDGGPLRITILPVAGHAGSHVWLPIDRPAALLHVARPDDDRRARIERLARMRGLTRAEAGVALEIARGDGRAAAAMRLGISENTMRTHLSAVFDKLGIHRQAELARLVAED